jgi:ribosomal protein S18 acetylase RimI-like enzyme
MIGSMEVRIAPCARTERPRLYELARAAFDDRPEWDALGVLDVLSRDRVFVALRGGRPAGYLALSRAEDGSVVVDQLLVAGGHERRGIGRRLLEYAEGYALLAQARALRILVEEDNLPARDFYGRCGFRSVQPEVVELALPQRSRPGGAPWLS